MEVDKKNKIDEIVADLLADYKDDKIINQEAFFSQPDKDEVVEAGTRGGNMTTAFNAANEKAVAMFLDRKISYLQITEIIEAAMNNCSCIEKPDVEQILATEQDVYDFINSRW